MSNCWYYGPGTDGSTPTLLLTGTAVSDAASYVGTVSQSGEWSNNGYTSMNYWPWRNIGSKIKSVLTLENNPISMTSSSNMIQMFRDFSSLTSIDVSGFNTSNVINMSYMFSGCSRLSSIDVSGFDTSKVINMNGMFINCSSLVSIDVSGFDTSKVTDMSGMFNNCLSLVSIDVSGFDTSKVTDMGGMFNNCPSLVFVDLSGFNTSKVTNIGGMFNNCSSLVSIDVSGFDTSKVTNMNVMFNACSALRIIDISDSMEKLLPMLPAESYYNVETGESAPRGSLTKGTWVRDEADISLVSTMIQDRQAIRSLRHMANKLSKRIVALETSVSSLVQ